MAFRPAQMAIWQPHCQARLLWRTILKRRDRVKLSVQVSLRDLSSPYPWRGSTDPGLDEIALYDRQIRLWGVKAQEK